MIPKLLSRLAHLLPLLILLVLPACSGGKDEPVTAGIPGDIPVQVDYSVSSRILWGMWDMRINLEGMTIELTPVRETLGHFDVTHMILPPDCPDCLQISINSYYPETHILDFDVTLWNKVLPTGYDVRGIIFTDDVGHLLTNPDDWTALWDIPGGGDVNPFRAYAKDEPHRVFEQQAIHTENFKLYLTDPPQYGNIRYAVDASWPGNCREPYSIGNFSQETIYNIPGSSGNIFVDVFDWQNDVSEVLLLAPEITGEDAIPFTHQEGNTWTLEFINVFGVLSGSYDVWIRATSENAGDLALYDTAEIAIADDEIVFNPSQIDTPWLYNTPWDVFIDGNYAYMANDANGLGIYDITDPENPVWVNSVSTSEPALRIWVSDGYAYVACMDYDCLHGRLDIIDVEPPESAALVNSVTGFKAYDVAVSAGYAYVGAQDALAVIDVDPVEDAQLISQVDSVGTPRELVIIGEYIYASESGGAFEIFHIDEPGTLSVTSTVLVNYCYGLAVDGGYAYLACPDLVVIDVDPPEQAEVITTLDMPHTTSDVVVAGNYAFVTNQLNNLQIVNIEQPDTPYITGSLELPSPAANIITHAGYAYVPAFCRGMYIVDITDPESAEHINTLHGINDVRFRMDVAEDRAYVVNNCSPVDFIHGFAVLDISQPEMVNILGTASSINAIEDQNVSGEFLYLGGESGLDIVDIEPIDSAHVVASVSTPETVRDVVVDGGYAYALYHKYQYYTCGGLSIIDVDPPESAHLVKDVEINPPGTMGYPGRVAISDGYAYIAGYSSQDGHGRFYVVDIDPPESADIVAEFQLQGSAHDVAVSGDRAYVANDFYGLAIFDITNPESPVLLDTVGSPTMRYTLLTVSGGYVFVIDGGPGHGHGYIDIFDIDPPELLPQVEHFWFLGGSYDIHVYESHAYIPLYASTFKGLGIFKLW